LDNNQIRDCSAFKSVLMFATFHHADTTTSLH